MKPDLLVQIRFKTEDEGGRKNPLKGTIYSCAMIIEHEAYDCRIIIKDNLVELGKFYELQVKFLNYSLVEPKVSLGKSIALWEGRKVAEGVIKEIYHLIQEGIRKQ